MKENLRNASEKQKKYEIEQCKFKKNNELVTGDFNWLKDL